MKIIDWAGRHVWLGWLLCLPLFWQIGVWAADREPPFAIIGPLMVTSAGPGQTAFFVAHARRDLDRECSVRFSRYLIDGAGMRFDFWQDKAMSAEGLRSMSAAMQHQLRLAIEIPAAATPGPAVYGSELRYVCNPLHKWWPIEVSLQMKFVIIR